MPLQKGPSELVAAGHLYAHTFDIETPIPHMFQASSHPKGKREQDLTAGSQVDDAQCRWWRSLERTTQRCASLLRKGAGPAMLVRRICRLMAIVPDPEQPSTATFSCGF